MAKWNGVRDAGAFAIDCKAPSRPGADAAPSSEDCLYLNLWTPARSPGDKLAAMVWIYGSGFRGGSLAIPRFDGEALAQKGVILISMNYRNNVMGFLSHPLLTQESANHSSGNYGLMDLVASLKWVQNNVAKFGGDPGKAPSSDNPPAESP